MPKIVLETQNLTKHYGDLTAVDGLDLAVTEGEIFGFLGPNGAGKTTAINMMVGLLKPDAGQVLIQGQKLKKPTRVFAAGLGSAPRRRCCGSG